MASDPLSAMDTFIRETHRQQGYPLTLRQIQKGLNVSSSSVVAYRVGKLVAQGRVTREPKLERTIRPVESRS